ncbi:COL6A [Mytilus coruscus]|uniref:COL6A n=1 Tax=Mytilus coruscus TaxID=42192 RepID=A0A6J8BP12_MYTCO|nr:COL6A [Mytilus coruscus]
MLLKRACVEIETTPAPTPPPTTTRMFNWLTSKVSPTETQVGALKFSNIPEMHFHLTDYTNKQDVAAAVSRIKWKGGNTFLDKALRMLRTEGLNKAYGSREENVPQIAVIITDGVSTDSYATKQELKRLHTLNYILFAIGVGPDRNPEELARIANNPNNVFEVESLNGLQATRESLVTRICAERVRAPVEIKKP